MQGISTRLTASKAAQKFDHGTIRLLSNTSKENRMGNRSHTRLSLTPAARTGGDRRKFARTSGYIIA